MISLIVSSLLLGLVVLGPAGAAQAHGPAPHPRSEPKEAGAELAAVNACVRQVRQFQPAERFEARVSLNGDIRPTGSEAAIGRFKDCLQQAGYPME